MTKRIVILFALLGMFRGWAIGDTPEERYCALKATKEDADQKARKRLSEALFRIDAERDIAIFRGFLKLNREYGLPDYTIGFTGIVEQKIDATIGSRKIVLRTQGSHETLIVTAESKQRFPQDLKVGDYALVTGQYRNGGLTGVSLVKSTIVRVEY